MPGKNSDIQLPVSALIPPNATLPGLREAAAKCQGCDLWKKATQTVFGEGSGNAKVVLVGEQPGGPRGQGRQTFRWPGGADP